LRAAIIDRHYQPGDRLREEELAAWLAVSRTPVREALARLTSEGIVATAPGRGLIVRKLGNSEIDELYALREVLEGTAARFAAQHASEPEIAAMLSIVDTSKRARGNYDELARLNRRFHAAVYGACHNRFLLDALDNLTTSLALLPGTTLSLAGRETAAVKEHTAIVEAIRLRNGDLAEELTRRHVELARRLRLKMNAD
jgi:DNA-binding GntR family transcriptional regulator